MKFTRTDAIFMDLILCAVGCMLLFFSAQVSQPRSGNWDDRPMIVSGRAEPADPRAWRGTVTFRWVVRAPDGANIRPAAPLGTTLRPESLTTRPRQDALAMVPEPSLGSWSLRLVVLGSSTDPPAALVRLGNSELLPRYTDALAGYSAAFAEYSRLLRKPGLSEQDYTRFAERFLPAVEFDHFDKRKRSGESLDPRLKFYIACRKLRLEVGIYSALADRSTAKADKERFAKLRDMKADKLHEELTQWVDRQGWSRDKTDMLRRLQWGLMAEERVRRRNPEDGRLPTSVRDKEYQVAWQALSEEVRLLAGEAFRSTQDTWQNNRDYLVALAELIRQRAVFDFEGGLAPIDQPPLPASLLENAVRLGTEHPEDCDPLLRLIQIEIALTLRTDIRVYVDVGAAWGDRRWPPTSRSAGAGAPTFNGVVALGPEDLEIELPILDITLPARGGNLSVRKSGRLIERTADPNP